ncbi:MAG: TonB-dependent receptor, partial [Bacteroidales bacterium]
MKRCTTTLVLYFFILPGFGQTISNYTISGYVKEKVSRESLIGVNVYLSDHKIGTTTNNYGFYSITLPSADSVELIVSYVGFTPEIVKMKLNKNIELDIDLKPSVLLDEVTVTSSRIEKQSQSVKMSIINLQIAQIKNVPSLFGEKDVLKVLQYMPGVQTGSEGSSGLYVRGGGPDQNLIILDDAIVYNASHLFGFFSLFNGDALKSVELTKGGFPARYGGRLSSVLDINMKEGNKEEWHGEGGIGLISSRMTLEGPIKKGKSSILLSGRRTYADLIMSPFLGKEKIGYYFYDLNAKINYDFGRKNKLYLSGYFGNDKFSMKTNNLYYNHDIGFSWGNGTGTLRWNHLFTNKLFSNTSAIFSNYTFRIFDIYQTTGEAIKDYRAEYYSGIKDYSLKYDIDYLPNPNHRIKAGAISIFHRFNPYAFIEEDIPNNTHINDVTFTNSLESGIYFEDTWQALHNLKVNGGIRFSHFLADQNQYHFFEPRLSVALNLKNDFAVKGSYASMSQYIHMISNTGISLPTDLWVPTTDKVKPQESQQLALGLVKDFSKPDITFSLEGYYKKMDNVIGYKEGASFMNLNKPTSVSDNNWEAKVTEGDAWSYGLELLLQKKEGRLSGWIGYTLSWTQMQFDAINFGRKFWARYDRRHD